MSPSEEKNTEGHMYSFRIPGFKRPWLQNKPNNAGSRTIFYMFIMAWEKGRWKKDKGKKGKEDGKGGRRRRRRNRRTAGGTFSSNLVLLASSIVLALLVVERARSNSVTRLQTKHLRNFGKCGNLATKICFRIALCKALTRPETAQKPPCISHINAHN